MRFPLLQPDGIPLNVKAVADSGVWYGLGLEHLLDGETISSATWTVPAGLTKDAEQVNAGTETHDGVGYPAATLAKVKLSGGTADTKYRCSVSVTTSGTQTFVRAYDILVKAVL